MIFGKKFEILMVCKSGATCVTVARVRNATAALVEVNLDNVPIRIVDGDVISGNAAYRGVTIEMQQSGRDVLIMLSCPQTPDPAEFALVYPRGLPSLSVRLPAASNKLIFPKIPKHLRQTTIAWPRYA